jgi:hypothetical protein
VTIFNPSTPLHDGAVIVQNERIAAASVFLPLTKNPSVSRELGHAPPGGNRRDRRFGRGYKWSFPKKPV